MLIISDNNTNAMNLGYIKINSKIKLKHTYNILTLLVFHKPTIIFSYVHYPLNPVSNPIHFPTSIISI